MLNQQTRNQKQNCAKNWQSSCVSEYKTLYKVLYFEGCSEGEGGSAEQTVTMKLKCCRRNILDSEDTFVIMLGQS